MPRSKPRYPKAVDDAFITVCEYFKVEPFSMETLLVCQFVKAAKGVGLEESEIATVSRIAKKIDLTSGSLPEVLVGVGEPLPF